METQKQKGFAPVIILILIALAVMGYFGYKNYWPKIQPSPTPSATTDPTTSWNTYTNSQYGFEFKAPTQLETTNVDGSVIVSGKTYQTKQLTMQTPTANASVRIIFGWTNVGVDPYGVSTFAKQIINGNAYYTAYTENIVNEPGCFYSTAHILTADQKNTIELGVNETCPSDTKVKTSFVELDQILSTFKFTD